MGETKRAIKIHFLHKRGNAGFQSTACGVLCTPDENFASEAVTLRSTRIDYTRQRDCVTCQRCEKSLARASHA